MTNKEAIEIVEGFKGEYAEDYKNTYDYVVNEGWEKDYFSDWLNGCSNYPTLEEIKAFCIETDEIIRLYCEFEIKEGAKLIGKVYRVEDGFCYECADDNHQEFEFKTAEKAEDALLEYYYGNIDK